jgi:asparagine synthase (glutamine-hydrolysing)
MIGAETAYEPGWLNTGWFSRRGVNFTFAKQKDYSLKEQLHHMLVESNLPMLLRHEDRLAMAHSIESRVPFLTASLVQFLLSLPEKYLISSAGTSKYVFRRAMRGIVPDEVLNRQDKIGFDTPEQQWLTKSQSWVSQVLRSEAGRRIPALNSTAMVRYWGEVVSGRRVYENKVWRWLNMIRWADKLQIEF